MTHFKPGLYSGRRGVLGEAASAVRRWRGNGRFSRRVKRRLALAEARAKHDAEDATPRGALLLTGPDIVEPKTPSNPAIRPGVDPQARSPSKPLLSSRTGYDPRRNAFIIGSVDPLRSLKKLGA